MQVLHRFSALSVLNLLFLCSCIPIFTISAALAAMYDAVFRRDTDRETKAAAVCFGSFQETFKDKHPSLALFPVLMGTGCGNAVFFSGWRNVLGTVLSIFSLVILCNTILFLSYTFPLMSQFQSTKRNTLKNALLLSIANLPKTLVIAVINCFPLALLFMNLYAFIQLSYLWLVLYFAAAAYFISRILGNVFAPLKEHAEIEK